MAEYSVARTAVVVATDTGTGAVLEVILIDEMMYQAILKVECMLRCARRAAVTTHRSCNLLPNQNY